MWFSVFPRLLRTVLCDDLPPPQGFQLPFGRGGILFPPFTLLASRAACRLREPAEGRPPGAVPLGGAGGLLRLGAAQVPALRVRAGAPAGEAAHYGAPHRPASSNVSIVEWPWSCVIVCDLA